MQRHVLSVYVQAFRNIGKLKYSKGSNAQHVEYAPDPVLKVRLIDNKTKILNLLDLSL
jgi:hypothetical protein